MKEVSQADTRVFGLSNLKAGVVITGMRKNKGCKFDGGRRMRRELLGAGFWTFLT